MKKSNQKQSQKNSRKSSRKKVLKPLLKELSSYEFQVYSQELWAENEKRWAENDRRWDENEKRWDENEKRWDHSDNMFQRVIDKLLEHDRRMDEFVTRAEFDAFRRENLILHERTASILEKLVQEMAAWTRAHDRLENRVEVLEEVCPGFELLR